MNALPRSGVECVDSLGLVAKSRFGDDHVILRKPDEVRETDFILEGVAIHEVDIGRPDVNLLSELVLDVEPVRPCDETRGILKLAGALSPTGPANGPIRMKGHEAVIFVVEHGHRTAVVDGYSPNSS